MNGGEKFVDALFSDIRKEDIYIKSYHNHILAFLTPDFMNEVGAEGPSGLDVINTRIDGMVISVMKNHKGYFIDSLNNLLTNMKVSYVGANRHITRNAEHILVWPNTEGSYYQIKVRSLVSHVRKSSDLVILDFPSSFYLYYQNPDVSFLSRMEPNGKGDEQRYILVLGRKYITINPNRSML